MVVTGDRAATSDQVRLGDVTVDLAGHRLLRDGAPLPVKPKAFELLAFLLRNPGQVFTRDQLLERVWGYDYAGETRTVDVHVHWLRGHIEDDPAHPRFPADGPWRGLRAATRRRLDAAQASAVAQGAGVDDFEVGSGYLVEGVHRVVVPMRVWSTRHIPG